MMAWFRFTTEWWCFSLTPPPSVSSLYHSPPCPPSIRYVHSLTILSYTIWNGLAPQYLCDLFNSNDSMHSYNTRSPSQFWATKSHTAYYCRSFTISGLNLWNSLPINIQEGTSLSSFKSVLFKFIGAKPQF